MTAINEPKWGTYFPSKATYLLQLLIHSGLGRGKLRHAIIHQWEKAFGSVIDTTVRGVKYRLDFSNNVTDGQIFFSRKIYDGKELTLLKNSCKNSTFIDIGANIGYYSLFLATEGASQVVAIEPNPPTLNRLRYNTKLNKLEDVISIVPIGMGSKDGTFEIYSSGDLGSASLLPSENCNNSHKITVKPLFSLLKELNIKQVGGLKIDVEGVEDQVLFPFFDNAPQSLWPKCIVIEHSSHNQWKRDIIAHMKTLNYVQQIRTRGNTVLSLKT